jgi:hypothetical protein
MHLSLFQFLGAVLVKFSLIEADDDIIWFYRKNYNCS